MLKIKEKLGKRNFVISMLLLLIPALWVSTGSVNKFKISSIPTNVENTENKKSKFYKIEKSVSYEVFDNITLYGVAYAEKKVTILSELNGRISKVFVDEGDKVEANELLVSLDERQYKAALEKAKSNYEMEKINLAATEKLHKEKLVSSANLAKDKAKFADAKALFEAALNDYDNIEIRSPFAGKIEKVHVEQGEVISQYNTKIIDFINDDKIIIRAYIPENKVLEVKLASQVNIKVSTGYVYVGKVSYISSVADSETRTYLIEVVTDNANSLIKSGMTAELQIPTLLVRVHQVNSSALSISDNGKVGMKYVDDDGVVRFSEVEIVKEKGEDMLVTGLSAVANIIVTGHGFIKVGTKLEEADE